MTLSLITHHMGREPDTKLYKVNRITPIVRLGQLSDVVFLQGGHAFGDDGNEIELPGWAYAAMARLTPASLKDAGYTAVPTPPTGTVVEEAPEQVPQMWQCPACEKVMDERSREAHIAKHNVRLSAEQQLGPDGKPKGAKG